MSPSGAYCLTISTIQAGKPGNQSTERTAINQSLQCTEHELSSVPVRRLSPALINRNRSILIKIISQVAVRLPSSSIRQTGRRSYASRLSLADGLTFQHFNRFFPRRAVFIASLLAFIWSCSSVVSMDFMLVE